MAELELVDWFYSPERKSWVNRWDKSITVEATFKGLFNNKPINAALKNTLLNNIAMRMKKSRRKKI